MANPLKVVPPQRAAPIASEIALCGFPRVWLRYWMTPFEVIQQSDNHHATIAQRRHSWLSVRDRYANQIDLGDGESLMRPQFIVTLGTVLLTASTLATASCDSSSGTSTRQTGYTITEPVTSLKVDNPVGDTRIEGTDATTVSVTERLTYTGNPPQTSHSVNGGRLTLGYTCPSGFPHINSCGVTYVVKVPRHIAVQIDDEVGRTTLSGLAGPLTLNSSTGDIDAAGLTSGAVTARASAGTITLGFTAPPTTVDARAEVGSVTVQLPADTAYAVDAGSEVGSIKVTVARDPGSAHRVTAQSHVGSVTVQNT